MNAPIVIFRGLDMHDEWWRFGVFTAILWVCYEFVEQQTIALMLLIKNSYTAATTSIAFTNIYIVLASGTVR